jgi:hypothetical protein
LPLFLPWCHSGITPEIVEGGRDRRSGQRSSKRARYLNGETDEKMRATILTRLVFYIAAASLAAPTELDATRLFNDLRVKRDKS